MTGKTRTKTWGLIFAVFSSLLLVGCTNEPRSTSSQTTIDNTSGRNLCASVKGFHLPTATDESGIEVVGTLKRPISESWFALTSEYGGCIESFQTESFSDGTQEVIFPLFPAIEHGQVKYLVQQLLRSGLFADVTTRSQ
jgi:hypothetical protein